MLPVVLRPCQGLPLLRLGRITTQPARRALSKSRCGSLGRLSTRIRRQQRIAVRSHGRLGGKASFPLRSRWLDTNNALPATVSSTLMTCRCFSSKPTKGALDEIMDSDIDLDDLLGNVAGSSRSPNVDAQGATDQTSQQTQAKSPKGFMKTKSKPTPQAIISGVDTDLDAVELKRVLKKKARSQRPGREAEVDKLLGVLAQEQQRSNVPPGFAPLQNPEEAVLEEDVQPMPAISHDEEEDAEPQSKFGRFDFGTFSLPETMQRNLEAVLERCPVSKRVLREDALALHKFLHARKFPDIELDERLNALRLADEKQKPYKHELKYRDRETWAYLAARLPIVHGTTWRAVFEAFARDVKFTPTSVLDFGSGVGASAWAAVHLWPQLKSLTCVDISLPMLEMTSAILKDRRGSYVVPQVNLRQYLSRNPKNKHDLVIASYTLSELRSGEQRLDALTQLWKQTGGYLVIVEYGSPGGFALINEARDHILSLSNDQGSNDPDLRGHVFAPCPHSAACPRAGGIIPCNFPVRANYSPELAFSKHIKGTGLLNEKFSFLVMKKGRRDPDTDIHSKRPRIVSAPLLRKGHVILDLCQSNGKLERHATSRSYAGDVWAQVRRMEWGDILGPDIDMSDPLSVRQPVQLKKKKLSDDKDDKVEEGSNAGDDTVHALPASDSEDDIKHQGDSEDATGSPSISFVDEDDAIEDAEVSDGASAADQPRTEYLSNHTTETK